MSPASAKTANVNVTTTRIECQGGDGQIAPLYHISWRSVKPLFRYGDFWIFPRWRPSAILDFLCACSNHPRRAFGGLYHCAKFGWNRGSSFANMHVFRFREFGLKTPIHAPKIRVLGGFYTLNGERYQRNPERHILARVRVVSAITRKSVDASE